MFGRLVRTHRQRLGLSQEQLAERVGMSARGIGKIESGRTGAPRPTTVRLLADAFGLSAADRDRFCAAAAVLDRDPADAAGPETPTDAVPALLPTPPAGFVGRSAELDRLDRALIGVADGTGPAAALAVVSGLAGVGKTALALHWAHRVRDRFPDGQLHADLHGHTPDQTPARPVEVLARFLRSLGVPPQSIPADLDHAVDLYRTKLAGRRLLVVADNVRDAAQVRPLFPGAGNAMVVVSRHGLSGLVARDGATRIRLAVLTDTEAYELVAAMLGDGRTEAERAAYAELAELCGGLPLALRIAAASVMDGPEGAVRAYVNRLRGGDRFAALTVPDDPSMAVREAFAASYAELNSAERVLFRRAALASGPTFTAVTAALVTGYDGAEAERTLHRLATAHLVDEARLGRFHLHGLLRQYAAERLTAEDDPVAVAAAQQRLDDYLVGTASAAAHALYPQVVRVAQPVGGVAEPAAFATDAAASAWLAEEQATLLATIDHAGRHGRHRTAWMLADALHGYLALQAPVAIWEATTATGLAAARAAGDPAAQAGALVSLAHAAIRRGRPDDAARTAEKAVTEAATAGSSAGEAAAQIALGEAAILSGRPGDAQRHFGQALGGLGRHPAPRGAVEGRLATLHWLRGDLGAALEHQRRALVAYRTIGSRTGEADALAGVAEDQRWLGRLADALTAADASLALRRELRDRGGQGVTLCRLASIHHDAGRYEAALDAAREALAIAAEVDHAWLRVEASVVIGSALTAAGRTDEAIGSFSGALASATVMGTTRQRIDALSGLAEAYRRDGRLSTAADCARQAVELATASRYRAFEGNARIVLAAVHLGLGALDQALAEARAAVALHHQTGHRPGTARALRLLASALERSGDPAGAADCRSRASAVHADIDGSPDEAGRTADEAAFSEATNSGSGGGSTTGSA